MEYRKNKYKDTMHHKIKETKKKIITENLIQKNKNK